MGYNKQMFHLVANQLECIAQEVDERDERLDKDDLFTAACSLNLIAVVEDCDPLTCDALAVAACYLGSFYERGCELPDALDRFIETVMNMQGYEQICNENYTAWVRKEL